MLEEYFNMVIVINFKRYYYIVDLAHLFSFTNVLEKFKTILSNKNVISTFLQYILMRIF